MLPAIAKRQESALKQGDGPVPQPENEGPAVPDAPGWMERMAMPVASWAAPTSGEESAADHFDIPVEGDRPSAETSEAKAIPRPGPSPIPIFGLGLVGLALIGQRRRRNSQHRSSGPRSPVSRESTRLQIRQSLPHAVSRQRYQEQETGGWDGFLSCL
ncbi:hypothetical protein [Singulisphaera acidiphila]|uniref:Uncharacterized protein n=1 Tax=Singulisphaera acidiphila (strain ATCC BAA-1392 / DSM 18658 / VKM B-2454 / MOB10) TaxID=886293 RepID=L0DGT2_SINAD|nr:hypothetical protein [Singulisphaera acidiphila]AGA28472.1 hypothetical protein Sinac_4273 [Singulisphaera acidiphila DSM 18658]